MNIKALFLSITPLANLFLSKIPSRILLKVGEMTALKTYNKALKVPAYKKFLKDNDQEIKKIRSIKQFSNLPITSKKNYILKYPFEQTNKKGDHLLYYRSSGYSGDPVYWSQDATEYKMFEKYVEFNLKNIFKIHKKKTLIISTFALSSWVTGQQVLSALYQLGAKYDSVTIFACGMVVEEPLDMIKRFGKLYDQIIIFSYPLTFKSLIDEGHDIDLDWTDYNVYAVIGAEGVTYNWCTYYNDILNKKDEDTLRIYSAFGAADTGIGLGSEQSAGIILKDYVYKNRDFRKELTGLEEMPLHLFQFNPLEDYLEEVDDELIITKDREIPLVRYNLHDKARIVLVEDIEKLVKKYDLDYYERMKKMGIGSLNLPYVFIYGRSDSTIILNGANIYMNSFKEALQDEKLARLHTGKFRVEKFDEEDMFQNYKLKIELDDDVEPTDELKEVFRRHVIEFLVEHDKGYAAAYHEPFKDRKECIVEFTTFEEDTLKHKYK